MNKSTLLRRLFLALGLSLAAIPIGGAFTPTVADVSSDLLQLQIWRATICFGPCSQGAKCCTIVYLVD